MSKELKQQIEALETENKLLKQQLEQKTKVAARALASYQHRSLHMEIIRQKNEDLDKLADDLEVRAQESERAVQELRQNEALLRTVMDATPDWIFIKDQNHRYQLVNKGYANSLHMTPEEFIGKNDLEIGFPEDIVKGNPEKGIVGFWPDDQTVMESGEPKYIEIEPAVVDDKPIWLSTRKVPLRDANDNVWGVLGFVHDITALENNRRLIAKRATELETVTRVGIAASTILNVDELLQQVTDLTKDSFGLYHAHIYLLDNKGDTLNLTSGAGKVGRKMVKQGWSIPLNNEQSLVAQAARTRQGVIVNNVREVAGWQPNSLLPDTFSELAVPLIAGNEVLGVLDVQSDKVDNFTDDDLRIQTTLAAQIAVALQNVRSFVEQQKVGLLLRDRVKELNCLNDIGREIASTPPVPELLQWITERVPPAMQHPELCVVAIEYNNQIYGTAKAKELPTQIVNALWVTGEIVGRIYIAYKEKQQFLDEESALLGGIASRVGSYIENRNLVEQAQQRAADLEETTNFLNSVIDNIPSGLFVKDAKDLRFLQWNKANEAIHGLKRTDLLGKSDYDFFSPEEAEHFVKTDRTVLADGTMVDIPEEVVNTPHKGTRVLRTRKIPVFGADGQPKFLLGISEDITESKQAEDALARERDLLQTLMDNSPDLIFFRDTDSRFIRTNNSHAQTILGLNSAEEAIGKSDFDLFLKEDAQKFYDEEQEIMRTGQAIYDREGQVPTIEGTIHWVSEHKIPIKDETGKVTGLLGIARDVTERKEAEAEREKLLAEVQQLAAIVETHPDFVAIVSLDGYPRYINPAGHIMIGLPPDHDVTTMHSTDFYPPADVERLDEGIQIVLEQGFWLAETNLLRADGSATPVERTISVIRDASGKPASFSITMRDITDRKVADSERERLLAEVEATYRQYVKGEWEQYLRDEHDGRWHIEYEQLDALLANGNDTAKMETPIALRGQQIGKFNLEDTDPSRKWTSEELALVETISEQLAQTIENLRLFDDTRRSAWRDQIVSESTAQVWSSVEIEEVMRTAVAQLGDKLRASEVVIRLGTESDLEE